MRVRLNFQSGTLASSASDSTTSLSSAGFAGLPEVVSGSGDTITVTLDPTGAREIVHIVAHDVAATSATVQRGMEGTSAAAHDSGTEWVHAPTAQDFDDPPSPDSLADWESVNGASSGYEFDGTGSSLPAGWSWVNQGGSTYVEQFGAGIIKAPSSGGSNSVRGLVMQAPVAPFVVEGKFGLSFLPGNFQEAGLLLRESSSGKVGTFSRNNTPSLVRGWFTNPTTYSTGTVTTTFHSPHIHLRLTVTTWASVAYAFSFDGVSWYTWSSGVNVTSQMTPDEIGFFVNSNASTALDVACHWFRVASI